MSKRKKKHAIRLARCSRALQQHVELVNTVFRLFADATISDISTGSILLLHKHGLADIADEVTDLVETSNG